MKFSVQSKLFYSKASAVSKVINTKNALTILNNFLISLEDETLTITGSDVENALSVRIPVSGVEGAGKFCVDARRLVDLLKEIPDQGLEFDVNDETYEMQISCVSGRYTLMTIDGNEYPSYERDNDETEPVTFTCPADQIITGFENTLFAVGDDEFRPMMMGVFLDIKPEEIVFVSTDTRKLVRYTNRTSKPGVETSCIMPVKPVTVIKNVFPRDKNITISMTNKSATISTESMVFNCRFIKGRFPDYTRVIPENNPYTMIIDRVAFLNAVRRVGVFVDPGFGLEKFRISNGCVEIKSQDPNLCTLAIEKVPCSYDGPELVIGFSAMYLVEICNTLSTTDIHVKLSDPGRPGVFCPSEEEEGSDLIMLLMPMTVHEF